MGKWKELAQPDDIHTCHADCQKPACVAARQAAAGKERTMTDRELMQQALDALDKLLDKLNADICDNSGIWDEYCDGGNAMQALRARLAQPEPEHRDVVIAGDLWRVEFLPDNDANVRLVKANYTTKQEKQEPVAWMHDSHVGFNVPLYTAPPQREWVGLTEEEVEKIANSASSKLSAIYIVEAELKGKNYDKS